MKKFLFTLLLAVPMAHAQWTQVATAGQNVTAVGNPTTWIRYGSPADNKWVYKAYTATKSFVVGGAEYTINPDPGANASTFVIQVFQAPLAPNVPAQTITVAGKVVTIPPASNTAVIPPTPGTFTISATCTVTTAAITCKQ